MKFLVYIFAFVFSLGMYAQEPTNIDSSKEPEVFKPVDVMPQYAGGFSAMGKFIEKSLVYPAEAKKKEIVGQPIVKFVIEETGKISNVQIRQSSGNKLLDDEAMRIVSVMPAWIPGLQNGKPVKVFFNLPIRFDVNNKLNEQKKAQAVLANKYYNDGVKYFGEQNYLLAKDNFKNALALNCYDTDSKYNLGTSYIKLNQKDSACIIWNDLKTSGNSNDRKEVEELIKKYCTN